MEVEKKKLRKDALITIGIAVIVMTALALYIYFSLINSYNFAHEIPEGPYEELTLDEVQTDSGLILVHADVHWVIAPNAVLVSNQKVGPYLVLLVADARQFVEKTPLKAGVPILIHGEVTRKVDRFTDESLFLGIKESMWEKIDGTPLITAYKIEELIREYSNEGVVLDR